MDRVESGGRRRATAILSLRDAIALHVHDGDSVALEGFTHLIPHAAGHEIIRQRLRDLTLIRLTPDIIHDQLIGVGAAKKLVFAWGGNPGVGSLYRFRDAIENGWPHPLEIVEHSHGSMAAAWVAGASRLPFGVLRGAAGTDLSAHSPAFRTIECPFTGETLTAVAAHRPHVTIIHAQRADEAGNIQIRGMTGVLKEAVLAADRAIVTVEEIVPRIERVSGDLLIPAEVIDAVCHVPEGAYPSYAQGHTRRDNVFYREWGDISRSRDRFTTWIDEYVHGTTDMAGFLARLRAT
jgi:glutaconate CoA-transferase subunit A